MVTCEGRPEDRGWSQGMFWQRGEQMQRPSNRNLLGMFKKAQRSMPLSGVNTTLGGKGQLGQRGEPEPSETRSSSSPLPMGKQIIR